ncbi:hypothetical protein M885DRAFT_571718 [Pelagophyceae sp. CCMP2097]|nr:hypothetical protein M885DRAFT_571718 [Pelagophyceae sp. CCMP2097]
MARTAGLVVLLGGRACAFAPRRCAAVSRRGVARSAIADEIEATAIATADSWAEHATAFLESGVAADVLARLGQRADVGFVAAGGYAGAQRLRLVFSHPDLDAPDAADFACLLSVTGEGVKGAALYNALGDIGIQLDQIGDILIDGNEAYVAIDPAVAKNVERLLPKALKGVAVKVDRLPPGSDPSGELQVAEIKRLDQRESKQGKRR